MLRGLKEFKLPEIEEKVLKFWKEKRIFEKSLEQRRPSFAKATEGKQTPDKKPKAKIFRFFEGPPYANGKPGLHHVLARIFKDVILRYKTMRGYYVPRKGGWDTHGLPVEIEVEKQLGIKSKKEIEKLGIALFNQKAKEAVWKYKDEWERMTERIGYWLDLKDAYVTYENDYIESLWWILKQIWEKGYLKKLHKVVPWCTRCETVLSSHELNQPGAYRKAKDPSVYVKFKVKSSKSKVKRNEYLLVWTTTPWTLPGNMAVAVHPGISYTKYKIGDEYLWSANTPPAHDGADMSVVEKMSGQKLIGTKYEAPYALKTNNKQQTTKNLYEVVGADFVNTEEGTGFVHVAPAFGEDDFDLWKKLHPKGAGEMVLTITDQGSMVSGFPGAGKYLKEADKDIAADLDRRKLLYHATTIEHEYPFCWRCSSPLIYFARAAWFIQMSRLRESLVRANEDIALVPAHVKEGRFGEWIKEAKDWAIGRERFWGTPLPIWECARCGAEEVVGGLDELDRRASRGNRFLLVRHGEATHNIKGVLAGGPERGPRISRLTKLGREQISAVAQAFTKEKIHLIVTSPFARARESARILSRATGARVIVDKRLREVNAGIFDGRPIAAFWKFFEKRLDRFTKTPPSGESLRDVQRRMVSAAEDINRQYRGKTIVLVSHGDPLWMLEGALRRASPEAMLAAPEFEVGTYRGIVFVSVPYNEEGALDLHRPYVDEISWKCSRCRRGEMRRVREVADVWFDSGAMPYAQWHYPFEHRDMIDKKLGFPADYISEALDQTRGWFYTLLAISVLLGRGASYRNVICLGLILDKNGQKMSKSKGNIVEPWSVFDRYGVDALRWYFFTMNDPGDVKRFDEAELAKSFRRFLLPLYHSFVFFDTYTSQSPKSNLPAGATAQAGIQSPKVHALDRWISSRLAETVREVTRRLDAYDVGRAGRTLDRFVDDLSRWYIRRSRERLSAGDPGAAETLREVLLTTAKLIAPFTPFVGEAIYQSLAGAARGVPIDESVHLADWPVAGAAAIDAKLLGAMDEVRRIAGEALAAREAAKIRVRQPLALLKIKSKILNLKSFELLELLQDEVNVKEIIFDPKIKNEVELDTAITPELKREGVVREVTRLVQQLRRDAGFRVGEPVALALVAPPEVRNALEPSLAAFKRGVGAKAFTFAGTPGELEKFAAKTEAKVDEALITLAIRKVRP